ncbi:hypothetical protein CO230_01485 [Chryseobacterium sp. 6424]|uniref:acyltransferase family protein n=1 Tax=Chryseobacterium sp. 6424 TaxID=2039166 RepID=UPI000EFBD990|nr:acyltransferase family protein [Chryseobacterium sp. 6424]AYO56916.1 hypothetical protein CO230_01485 [Chryseobacterium sp. 6424]
MALRQDFRYDISFLRIIAVFAVVFFHFQLPFFSGGFSGVDIFFVISGFLMTKIILNGYDRNNFNLLAFYGKRLQRIFPALIGMVAVFFAVVYFLTPLQLLAYSRTAVQSLLFISNIYFYNHTGYFQESAHNNYLLHTWSLSVEWQFYLIYPLILLLVQKSGKQARLLFLLSASLVSFLIMLYIGRYDKSPAFFLLPARAWEMMAGGIALLVSDYVKKLPKPVLYTLYFGSFLTLLYFVFKANSFFWPAYDTLFPTLATAFIISADLDFKILRSKVVKYFGDISYSLYLYHWPLFVLSLFLGKSFQLTDKAFFIGLSIIAAAISYQFVEKRNYSNCNKTILAVITVLVLFFLLFTPVTKQILKDNYTLASVELDYPKSDAANEQYLMEKRHFMSTQTLSEFPYDELEKPSKSKKNIILLGDSHAGMFSQTVRKICEKNNWNLIQITADATYPMPESPSLFKGPVEYFNWFYSSYLPVNQSDIDMVLMNINYVGYSKEDILKKTANTSSFFTQKNIPVIYIGLTKRYAISFPSYYYATRIQDKFFGNQKIFDKSYSETNAALAKQFNDYYIDIYSRPVKEISLDKIPYIYDSNHLTFYGTELYSSIIEGRIKEFFKKQNNEAN